MILSEVKILKMIQINCRLKSITRKLALNNYKYILGIMFRVKAQTFKGYFDFKMVTMIEIIPKVLLDTRHMQRSNHDF